MRSEAIEQITSPAGGGARRAEGDSVFITVPVFVLGDRVPLRPYGPPPPAGEEFEGRDRIHQPVAGHGGQ